MFSPPLEKLPRTNSGFRREDGMKTALKFWLVLCIKILKEDQSTGSEII